MNADRLMRIALGGRLVFKQIEAARVTGAALGWELFGGWWQASRCEHQILITGAQSGLPERRARARPHRS